MHLAYGESIVAPSHGKLFQLLAGHILETSPLKPVLDFIAQAEQQQQTNGILHSLAAPPEPAQLAPPKKIRVHHPQRNGMPFLDSLILDALQSSQQLTWPEAKQIAVANGFAGTSASASFTRLIKAKLAKRVIPGVYVLAPPAATSKALTNDGRRPRQDRAPDGRSTTDVVRDFIKLTRDTPISRSRIIEELVRNGFSNEGSTTSRVLQVLQKEKLVMPVKGQRGMWIAI